MGPAGAGFLLVDSHHYVAAALFESYRFKENLPLSMITGKRRMGESDSQRSHAQD